MSELKDRIMQNDARNGYQGTHKMKLMHVDRVASPDLKAHVTHLKCHNHDGCMVAINPTADVASFMALCKRSIGEPLPLYAVRTDTCVFQRLHGTLHEWEGTTYLHLPVLRLQLRKELPVFIKPTFIGVK